uniref:Uncharacterized protein n=1 Tax=Anguilla anguilla TaxID=7936 RepID=A0A0E9Q2U1_ANGAN
MVQTLCLVRLLNTPATKATCWWADLTHDYVCQRDGVTVYPAVKW